MTAIDQGNLRRVIGFWGGTALIVGITIGSGIFRKPPTIAGLVPNPLVIMGLWTAFGLISVCGALTAAELSSLLPRPGGVYVFLHEAFGDAAAFVFGWLYVLVTTPANIAALATVFSEFFLNLLGITIQGFTLQSIAIAAIVALTAVNLLGAQVGAAVGGAFTLVKVAALAAIILGAFLLGHGSFSHFTGGPVPRAGLARAVASVIWTYDGWIAVTMIAGEVVAPERLMKRIIIAGMLVIVTLYIGANLAYFYMMPVEVMADEKAAIARTVMTSIAGPAGGTVILISIVISVLGALNGNCLAKPRVAYAMARDGLTFSFLGKAHPRWSTPWAALLVQGGAATAMVLALRDFDTLTTYFVVVEWAALIVAVAAVFVLRRKMPDVPRPYRTPGYPWVPLLFIAGTAVGLTAIVWGEITVGNYSPLYGLAIAAAGFPVYHLWKRLTRAQGPAPVVAV
ncbi:MAG TPA: amino acid permease [Vicinamibacterales bacterium]|jgi:APA family basic amino acid/polyamine antiporter|nr:amino acid permease [Vicinamibacterales bacterium]